MPKQLSYIPTMIDTIRPVVWHHNIKWLLDLFQLEHIHIPYVINTSLCIFIVWHMFKMSYNKGIKSKIKEACYSRVPIGIPLHVSIFPILAVLKIHFMVFGSSPQSNLSICRPRKFPLYPMKPRKLSSWTQGDEILTIWDRLRQKMLRSPKINCIMSP